MPQSFPRGEMPPAPKLNPRLPEAKITIEVGRRDFASLVWNGFQAELLKFAHANHCNVAVDATDPERFVVTFTPAN